MARRKNGGAKVGDMVFYKWKGEALPALIQSFIGDADGSVAILAVFSSTGVNMVSRVSPGNGDGQYAASADAPAPVKEAPEESE